MPGFRPAAVLDRRSDASCPQDNGTVWSADGYSWAILCNYDFPGNDLPAQPATSLTECIDACNNYKQNEQYLSGASCVAVVYGAANTNGNPCYLKAKIDTVKSGNYMQYVARRTQYNIGQAPIYTSIAPSGSTTSPPAQASTFAPSVLSSIAIIDSSTPIAITQPLPSTLSTVSRSSDISNVLLASASDTTGKASLSSSFPTTTLDPPQVSISILTQNSMTQNSMTQNSVTQNGVTQTTTALASASASIPATTENMNTDMTPASTSATSTPTSFAVSSTSSTSSISSTSPASSTSSSTSSASSSLSDGAKIGIGVGLGVAVAIIISLILYIFCTRRQRKQTRDSSTIRSTELPPTTDISSKSTLLSRTLPPHPSANYGGKAYLASEIPEMSSPQPAATELESEKLHELAGGMHPSVSELDSRAYPVYASAKASGM